MTNTITEIPAEITNLDDLLSYMTDRNNDREYVDFSSLPTFGGEEPADTLGIWSWDETRVIVGECADDYQIINRNEI